MIMPLSACLASVDSPAGRRRVEEHLRSRPYPHYEAAAGSPGLLVRIESDVRRTLGRYVNRQFQPALAPPQIPAKRLPATNKTKRLPVRV
jgi:hypothetical protein